jgi:hypothetical protein
MAILRHIAIAAILVCLTSAAAMAFEPMTATVRVSSGSLYDYVVIGEDPKATDGYDNPYDTLSPGNLNASMGLPYITAVIVHPEWKKLTRELRGDVRTPAKRQEWQLSVSSSLPKGTQLAVGLQKEKTIVVPKGMKLTLRDGGTGKQINLLTESCTLPAPGPGASAQINIIAEQP